MIGCPIVFQTAPPQPHSKARATCPYVFVGGDCANGGAEIVNAAAEGVAAAKQIHERLTHG